jgi:anti-sigma factor RsiW
MSDNPKKHHRQKDLLAYVQGFLGPEETRELEEHMRGCPDCQKTLEEVRRFLPALQQALTPQVMPTEVMWANVQRQFRSRPPAKEPFFTRMRVALMASGAALATTILIVIRPLLTQAGPDMVAERQQSPGGRVFAPRRPEPPDAGPDAGMGTDGGTVGR